MTNWYDVPETRERIRESRARQNGICPICKRWFRFLYCDHDHETIEFRELLCPRCNTGIGQFEDSIVLLESAIAYLRKHGKA